ncbi:MAG: serpin family protein, partial [Clostridia bacterium]|nr:serpin family protein [Clostridia bacterium]
SLILVCAIALNLNGCTLQAQAKDLMKGMSPNSVNSLDSLDRYNSAVTDFAVRLFRASAEDGKNVLLSPLSVLCALAMTANGAENETLEEMEAVLGMSKDELNLYVYSYINSLPDSNEYKLSLANSIWFTGDERFTVSREFLQANADYYGADIYKAPFNDKTCREINKWVKHKTDSMIPEIVDEIPTDAVMYLVNALAFEAQWRKVYEKDQVRDGEFTKEDGTKQTAEFMYGMEGTYLEDEKASGFVKYYKGGKYAFVAMLPDEGVSVSEYVASLDGEKLRAMLSDPGYTTVSTALPKFETEYSVEMNDVLKSMGMSTAFSSDEADFTALGTSTRGNIYINRVLHRTYISVGEKGTKAGAATAVEMADEAGMETLEPKEIYLDRPFVYMLIDTENNIPFFIGTMTDIES